MRRMLSCVVMVLGVGACRTQTPGAHPAHETRDSSALGRQIAALLQEPAMSRAHWGIAVTTLDGTPIFGWNEGQFFRPASNAKLYTTAAAMALLGPETRVTTVVSSDAPPDANGIVQGDIVLHGAGDANLSGRKIPYEEPAAAKARLATEQARETAAEKTAAKAAARETEAAQARTGQAVDDWAAREVDEAENTAAAGVRDQHLPEALAPMDDLAAQVAAKGVKGLTGAVRGDQSLWRSPGYADSWDVGDAVWGYGAAVSALEFNDGQLQMVVTPGLRVGDQASVWVEPNVRFAGLPHDQVTTVATEKEAEVNIEPHAFPQANVAIGSVALGHPDTEEIAVQDPALFAVTALSTQMMAHGIAGGSGSQTRPAPEASVRPWSLQVKEPIADLTPKTQEETSPVCGREFACGFVLAERASPTVAEDVTVTLKVSQNLHAEMLLRRLGRAYGDEGSFAQGVRVVRQWLIRAGLDGDDFVFYDGSGLSSHDLVTPRTTAQLLAYATTQRWFAPWKAALPVGGVDGSLAAHFLEPALKARVFAKTGTLGESLALSGYVECASGRMVIFSIFADTHAPGTAPVRTVVEKIVAAIAAAN
jgi:D-alanyl-D-alanine carboxypeptidase/D-alanyl-D-alanine-endopeptidase (penicillin-binding protein 4)